MRIIGGYLKGNKISYIKNINTRPLKDFVKESIFNILDHSNSFSIRLEKSKVLDLYSGVGSFGFECLSRGAKKVTFIEKDIKAFEILKKNALNLSVINKTKIINGKIEKVLKSFSNEKFNFFFFDPPFKDIQFIENLKLIKKNKIFEINHIIIIHRENRTKDNFENLIKISDVKEYGRSKILFGYFN